jgi:hypothetical protein
VANRKRENSPSDSRQMVYQTKQANNYNKGIEGMFTSNRHKNESPALPAMRRRVWALVLSLLAFATTLPFIALKIFQSFVETFFLSSSLKCLFHTFISIHIAIYYALKGSDNRKTLSFILYRIKGLFKNLQYFE